MRRTPRPKILTIGRTASGILGSYQEVDYFLRSIRVREKGRGKAKSWPAMAQDRL